MPKVCLWPIFFGYSSAEENTIHVLEGEDCTQQFLQALDTLVVVPGQPDQEQEILVVLHNLKGFDGMFILHELYQQQREVTEQLTVGAKVLSFRSGPIKFIDSVFLAHASGLVFQHVQPHGSEKGVFSSFV